MLKRGCLVSTHLVHSEIADVKPFYRKKALVQPPDEAGRPRPNLKTGVYFIPETALPGLKTRNGHLIYWPEYTSWDDDATSSVKRNRSTFMRYLTKLSDQVICLMSKDHSDAIVWTRLVQAGKSPMQAAANHKRMYMFGVQKTKEQEENVAIHEGFKVRWSFLNLNHPSHIRF